MTRSLAKKNTQTTSSPVVHHRSNASWASGLSQISAIEAAIMAAESTPAEINSDGELSSFKSHKDLITIGDEHGIIVNESEVSKWNGPIPIDAYLLNDDPDPKLIVKKSKQTVNYVQEYAIRYLRPPTPPSPGPIIIKEINDTSLSNPPPPLIIRQIPKEVEQLPPIIVREKPPTPLPILPKKVIVIAGKKLPPPPRRVIVERLPEIPQKPTPIIIERWLPYKQLKRKVIFERAKDDVSHTEVKPKNLIISWEPPEVNIIRKFKHLGTIRADPTEYIKKYGDLLKTKNELKESIKEINTFDSDRCLVSDDNSTIKVPYELEGDIEFLKYVDLQKEGLSEYKDYLIEHLQKKESKPKSPILGNFVSINSKTSPVSPEPKKMSNDLDIFLNKYSKYLNENVETKNPIMSENKNKKMEKEDSNTLDLSLINTNTKSNKSVESSNEQTESINEVTIPSLTEDLYCLIEQIFELLDTKCQGYISSEQAESFFVKLNNDLNDDNRNMMEYFKSMNIRSKKINLFEFKKIFLDIKCNQMGLE